MKDPILKLVMHANEGEDPHYCEHSSQIAVTTILTLSSTLDEKSSVHDNNAKENNWRPSLSMVNILVGIKSLLENPNPDSPANVDANRMYLG